LRGNCLISYVLAEKVAGRIELTGRRGIRSKQIMNDLKETIVPEPERGNTSSPSVENMLWKSFGPVVRRTTEGIKEWI
jgi:hypothetical protein